ncbi:Heavy metal-associated domain, HMA [Sesbania bispinosa]|nr:Heavy metal-associated domain, HMA [Sesbania bispinosa]
MMKVVLKVELNDEKIKQKSMKTVSGLSGIESVSMEMKSKKLTLIGDIDPIRAVSKLRKLCNTEIISVGPAKEEKKDQTKVPEPVKFYEAYPLYYQMTPLQYTQYHYIESVTEDSVGCVIC